MYPELSLFIEAERLDAIGRRREPVVNPATGQSLGLLPYASAGDLDRALESAQRAFSTWKSVPARNRAAILKRGAELIRERVDPIAHVLTMEQGKTLTESRGEVSVSADIIEWYAEEARRARSLRLGDGLLEGSDMGPLTNARRQTAMEEFVADATSRGARVRSGGNREGDRGYFFQPTVVTDPPDDSQVMTQEPFGPVVPITRFETVDDVINRANSLPVGLAAYAFTASNEIALAVGELLRAGMVGVNTLSVSTPETPFGGVRESGYGQEGGLEGMQAYLDVKLIAHARKP
jgi:acyl-CoA reductase-like NAD-dependent aldehyde dehydrogenase